MLSEERLDAIVSLVDKSGSVTVQDLVIQLGASESTIRRDITALANAKRLVRVHGGAMSLKTKYNNTEYEVSKRRTMYAEEKKMIGEYAASLIEDGDLVYIDAGTTTEFLIDNIVMGIDAVFVTNAVSHAITLSKKGYSAYILGGRLKAVTEAIVGSGAVVALGVYNFTKGFFGANGISIENGITTPEISEADLKRAAMRQCKESFVLADSSKFGLISQIAFANISDVTVITDKAPNDYSEYDIIAVSDNGGK